LAPDAWPAAIAAALLRRGAMVHALSAALTVAAVLAGGAAVAFGWQLVWPVAAVAVVIGLLEFWLAARVAVDADLFAALGAGDLARFDEAMRRLGLMPEGKVGRPMEDRVRGALRLLKLQAGLLLLQIVVMFASGMLLR
jgi:hypothetical protein